MSEENDGKSPALKGFSRIREMMRSTLKSTFGGAFKGMLIGAVAVPVITVASTFLAASTIPFGTVIAGGLAFIAQKLGVPVVDGVSNGLMSLALNGAMWGAGLGGVIGGAMGANNADEAADAKKQELLVKYQRSQQLEANARILKQNQERYAAMGGMQQPVQPQAVAMGMQPQNLPFGPNLAGAQQR